MKKQLGKYEIVEILGRGSMGVVYKGIDPQIHKVVAIKTMNQKVIEQADMRERFYREGTVLGQLQHKNIINVYNVGVDRDTCYIAMEYLEGTSLDLILQKPERVSPRRTLEIIRQVCEGVYAAHRQSIIHRDVKPANIFILEDDHVKVLDFGVAHFQNSQLTNSGVLLGTINYMAPEQITGEPLDHRADIFSIGVILYELLAGSSPFQGSNISQTMVKLVNQNPKPIEGIPAKLQAILDRALAKKVDNRYESGREMMRAIERVLRSESLEKMERQPKDEAAEARLRESQQAILNQMLMERAAEIKQHIRQDELEDAEALLIQLKKFELDHPLIADLGAMLSKAKITLKSKRRFAEQLIQETLLKANDRMVDRHYIGAIEFCQKVLKMDPNNQDARVIKAASINKLRRFIEQFGPAPGSDKS